MTGMTNPFDTPAYLEKFGLKEPPYTTNPDERYLYLTETHEEAIHMCGRLISNREGAGLIVGEQGTGKTTIMRRLHSLMQSHGQFQVSIIETAEHCPSLFQLSKEILESFGQPCVSRDTKSRLDQLKAFLLRSFAEQQTCVLMIDEAQQMKGPVLESLRGLLNFEDPTAGGKLMQIILFAMPGINKRLRYAPSFSNRLVRTELQRMKHSEMEDMLKWRFTQAGGRFFPFSPETLHTLFEITQGNPRTICGIAQVALEYAGATHEALTPAIMAEVAQRRVIF
jgi:general secretion pathway protein A